MRSRGLKTPASFARRTGTVLLLLYQAFFLNVVVPGHTRGAITLTGRTGTGRLEDFGCGCCCASNPSRSTQSPASKQYPTPKDRENCAICNLAAHYTPPPVFDFALGGLGLLKLLPLPPPAVIPLRISIPTYYACGPPVQA